MFLIKNLGSTLVYLIFIVTAFIFLFLAYIINGIFGIFDKVYQYLKSLMVWNFTLRILIQ